MGDKLRHDEAIPSPLADARRGSVTRLSDLAPDQAKRLAELECPDSETRFWVIGPALSIPSAVALGVLVRRGAPTTRRNRVGGRAFIRRLGRFRLRVRLPLGCPPTLRSAARS